MCIFDVHPLCQNVQITPLYGVPQGSFLGLFLQKGIITHANHFNFTPDHGKKVQ